jgi:hypothetical protein
LDPVHRALSASLQLEQVLVEGVTSAYNEMVRLDLAGRISLLTCSLNDDSVAVTDSGHSFSAMGCAICRMSCFWPRHPWLLISIRSPVLPPRARQHPRGGLSQTHPKDQPLSAKATIHVKLFRVVLAVGRRFSDWGWSLSSARCSPFVLPSDPRLHPIESR